MSGGSRASSSFSSTSSTSSYGSLSSSTSSSVTSSPGWRGNQSHSSSQPRAKGRSINGGNTGVPRLRARPCTTTSSLSSAFGVLARFYLSALDTATLLQSEDELLLHTAVSVRSALGFQAHLYVRLACLERYQLLSLAQADAPANTQQLRARVSATAGSSPKQQQHKQQQPPQEQGNGEGEGKKGSSTAAAAAAAPPRDSGDKLRMWIDGDSGSEMELEGLSDSDSDTEEEAVGRKLSWRERASLRSSRSSRSSQRRSHSRTRSNPVSKPAGGEAKSHLSSRESGPKFQPPQRSLRGTFKSVMNLLRATAGEEQEGKEAAASRPPLAGVAEEAGGSGGWGRSKGAGPYRDCDMLRWPFMDKGSACTRRSSSTDGIRDSRKGLVTRASVSDFMPGPTYDVGSAHLYRHHSLGFGSGKPLGRNIVADPGARLVATVGYSKFVDRTRVLLARYKELSHIYCACKPNYKTLVGHFLMLLGKRSRAMVKWREAIALAVVIGTPIDAAFAKFELGRYSEFGSQQRIVNLREASAAATKLHLRFAMEVEEEESITCVQDVINFPARVTDGEVLMQYEKHTRKFWRLSLASYPSDDSGNVSSRGTSLVSRPSQLFN